MLFQKRPPLFELSALLFASQKRKNIYTLADLLKIQTYWRDVWKSSPETYQTTRDEKSFVLSMFPYPSGSLHMGHVRVYTISDALSRYQRLLGKQVIHPMGWDAFGLPAENAAIERGIPPAEWTMKNILQMKGQLDGLSFKFDWDREITTCEPSYYRWTQWIFVRLFKAGLAYRKEGLVNWDPVDQTVLADEQVDSNGRSWRSGALVEKRPLTQWYLRITAFQDDLLDGLRGLSWPDAVKAMQEHWIIGSCEYRFKLKTTDGRDLVVVVDKPEDWLWAESLEGPFEGALLNPYTQQVLNLTESAESSRVVANVIRGSKKQKPVGTAPPVFEKEIREYRIRDWLISRQRYWGTPIPIIYCASCGTVPVPEKDLPVLLPVKGVSLTGKGGSALLRQTDWVNASCPSCGGMGRRETDTMDTFIDSSWYFARYTDPKCPDFPASPSALQSGLPVDVYIGGIEHAILHLLYARFINRFLMGQLGVSGRDEPFKQLITQGLVEGRTFRCPHSGRYLRPDEYKLGDDGLAIIAETGKTVKGSWEKMSKSKYNGIDPLDLVSSVGADTLRLCILFKAPPEIPLQWNTRDIAGPQRWLVRLLNLAEKIATMRGGCTSNGQTCATSLSGCTLAASVDDHASAASLDGRARVTPTINIEKHIAAMEDAYNPSKHRLNLAVSNLMKFSNEIDERFKAAKPSELFRAMNCLAIMLHPLAPHASAQIRKTLGTIGEPLSWPSADAKAQPRASAVHTVDV